MSFEEENLESLLLDFSEMSEAEAEAEGEALYEQLYLGRHGRTGLLKAHDGEEVKFFADRYHHAFHTSANRARSAYSKAVIAVDRIERVKWIGPMIQGRVTGAECWEVPAESHRPFPGKRVYIDWIRGYIVWLEPLKNGGFKFSTAYVVSRAELGRYTKHARKLWFRKTDTRTE